MDVAHDVTAGRHVALVGVGFSHVDDAVEQVSLAVLATEVLRQSAPYRYEGRASE